MQVSWDENHLYCMGYLSHVSPGCKVSHLGVTSHLHLFTRYLRQALVFIFMQLTTGKVHFRFFKGCSLVVATFSFPGGGGDWALGNNPFFFFFLCGHFGPPSAKIPWGNSFFFLVWAQRSPWRRKCRGVILSLRLATHEATRMHQFITNNHASFHLW